MGNTRGDPGIGRPVKCVTKTSHNENCGLFSSFSVPVRLQPPFNPTAASRIHQRRRIRPNHSEWSPTTARRWPKAVNIPNHGVSKTQPNPMATNTTQPWRIQPNDGETNPTMANATQWRRIQQPNNIRVAINDMDNHEGGTMTMIQPTTSLEENPNEDAKHLRAIQSSRAEDGTTTTWKT